MVQNNYYIDYEVPMNFNFFIISIILFLINNIASAEVTEDMRKRAKEAGVEIVRDHDVKRTYYSNDILSRDTHMNMQVAYRYSQAGDVEKAAQLELTSANRGLESAQVAIGKRYVHGNGIEQNVVEAYKFFKLSEDGTANNLYIKVIMDHMTKEQIAEAENLVKNFKATYK